MSEWKTIETAPRDGTVIDLWANGERLADCRWLDGDEALGLLCGWQQRYAETADSFCWLGEDFKPSHWMPRPPPPASQNEG